MQLIDYKHHDIKTSKIDVEDNVLQEMMKEYETPQKRGYRSTLTRMVKHRTEISVFSFFMLFVGMLIGYPVVTMLNSKTLESVAIIFLFVFALAIVAWLLASGFLQAKMINDKGLEAPSAFAPNDPLVGSNEKWWWLHFLKATIGIHCVVCILLAVAFVLVDAEYLWEFFPIYMLLGWFPIAAILFKPFRKHLR